MLLDGVGGPRNAMRGARWMHLAAEKGHMHAQALLGQMLIQGNVMPRRIPEGLMWLKLATEQADPSRDAWIAELHDTAITLASEEDRRRAGVYVQQRSRSAERR
jgi:TPR repeat protein